MENNESSGKLLVVGSVAFDSVETPFGKGEDLLGGSATYFSLAASNFTSPSVVAVVGEDFGDDHSQVLRMRNIDVSGIEQAKGKSFRWGGKYHFDLNSRDTLFTELNVFESFKPKLSAGHKNADYVFLGNIHPALQKEVLNQIEKSKFIGLDTMNFWMDNAPQDLNEVLRMIDIFIINDSEARQFSGEHNLVKAAKKILGMMKGKSALIIKRGEYGLLLFHNDKMFHLPGYPLEDVVDPTGAGDSFAGGFMGYLAKTDNINWDNLKKACVAGSVIASFCVEKLGTKRLQEISSEDINRRFSDFKTLTHFNI